MWRRKNSSPSDDKRNIAHVTERIAHIVSEPGFIWIPATEEYVKRLPKEIREKIYPQVK